MSKHHLLPDIQSLDSSALLFTANHIAARSMLVAEKVTLPLFVFKGRRKEVRICVFGIEMMQLIAQRTVSGRLPKTPAAIVPRASPTRLL
jgi:hypothetical protein